jgi:hypothetical protein
MVVVAGALVGALMSANDAHAWNYVEHVDLAGEAYRLACVELATRLKPAEGKPASADKQVRYDIACANLSVVSQLYGQATALAGDYLRRPEDLFVASVGKKIASRKEYLRLALVNSTHYHPLAPRAWREHHQQAIDYATKGAAESGLGAIEAFELAFYFSAFADHFLHDSFVSGHMGFNRSASSVAASLAFHDEWNRRGRMVRNRAGDSWKAYGDGRLNSKQHVDGRKHTLFAAKMSIYSVLVAFVEGSLDASLDLQVWRALPFVIEAPALPSLTDRLLGDDSNGDNLYPLGAINRPARKDKVLDLRLVASGEFKKSTPLLAGLVGFNLSLPRLPSRTRLAVGASLPRGDQDLHLMLDFGIVRGLGLTADGLLTHQVGVGFLWEARRDELAGSLHAGYQLTVELGLDLLSIEVGPALLFPSRELGFISGISYGRLFGAAGGGVR